MIFDHGQQWINTLRDYAFPKIGRMPLDSIDQTEVMMCLSPIWTEKHETARRLSQRIKTVLVEADAGQKQASFFLLFWDLCISLGFP
jgi:hypothetical protein